jgi:hypothetical protein
MTGMTTAGRREDAAVLRTSITATAAVAALALLSACGPVQMGQAAITGGSGIPTSTLNSEVSNLNAAYARAHGSIQYQFPASQVPQVVLSWLVRFQVRDQVAARRGITVTPAQAEQALAATAAQARQSSNLPLSDIAVANGLAPDMLPRLGRYQAIENALVRQLDGGKMPASQAGLQALSQQFNRVQCRAAKSLNIRINPQFGQLDYTQLAVVPLASTLSLPGGAKPSPSASPAPSC